MNLDIERIIVKSFLVKRKQERGIFELSHQKLRSTFIGELLWYLNPAYMIPLTTPIKQPEQIYQILQSYQVPDMCYAISSNYLIDAREISLKAALPDAVFRGPVLISCIHGKLAYFEGEYEYVANKNRYLLIR